MIIGNNLLQIIMLLFFDLILGVYLLKGEKNMLRQKFSNIDFLW